DISRHGKTIVAKHVPRPASRSSNVSRRRTLGSEAFAPSPEARDNTLVIDQDFTSKMADAINKYTHNHKTAISRQLAKYERYIKRLKHERSQGKKELEKCASQIEAQARTIQELQDREASMEDQIKSHENESAMAESRTQQIEEKYYMVKGFLNAAIEEQQKLYGNCKKQLREQIKSAHRQLEQKTSELERQQDENRRLSERLQSVKTETNGLESLVAQNKEILEKLDEQHTAASKKTKEVETETQAKQLNREIKALLKLLAGQPLEFINIQNSNKELAECITSKANEMAWCQNATEESTRKFYTDIETLVKQVLEHLNQQNQDTSQELSRLTEECGGLSVLVKFGENRCQELEAEIDAMKEDADKKDKEIHDLDEKLFHFQATDIDLRAAQQKVLSAEMDRQRLEDEVQSKVTTIKSLEEMLREKNEAHTLELSKYTTSLTKLNQMLRDKEDESRTAVEKSTELARSEMRIEMEKADAEAKKTLRLVEKERDAAAACVERLKQDLHTNEDKSGHDAQTIDSLKNSLAAAESLLGNLADEVKRRTSDLEELRARETAAMKTLEERISSVEKTAAERLGETRHLLIAIQQFIVALRKWSEWGPLPLEIREILTDFEANPPSYEEMDARFSEIVEKITAVIGIQQPPAPVPEMVIQDDSSSRFFPKDDNMLLDLHSPEQHGTGGGENMSLRPKYQQQAVFGNRPNDESLSRILSLLHDQRRVEVRSPALDLQQEPSPPSVEQEKAMRREAQQPRPIIKRSSQSDNRAAPMESALGTRDPKSTSQRGGGMELSTGSVPNDVYQDDDTSDDGTFTRRMDPVQPKRPVSLSRQQEPTMPSGQQQEPGRSDGQQKGKKVAGRKSHGSTVPTKRKSGPEETGRKLLKIKKSALTEESQQSLSSQDFPDGNGFGPRHPVERGLSPPESQTFSQGSFAGGLASQSQGPTKTTRTYATRQKNSQLTGPRDNSQSQLRI
ncbi:hypothetical protein QBC39DRAFT_408677, partial [Podospora conica]